MVTSTSSATNSTPALLSGSSSTTGAEVAKLKAELTAKQAELESAKTDEDRASINKEITSLKATISKAEAQSQGSSSPAAQAKASATTGTVAVTSADRAAPESKVPSAVMDVLMMMGSPGGERPEKVAPDFSKLYAELDSDDDGKLTSSEFVSGSADRMSSEQASALFDAMDTEDAGTLTEAQFTEGMANSGPAGPLPMGPPPVRTATDGNSD